MLSLILVLVLLESNIKWAFTLKIKYTIGKLTYKSQNRNLDKIYLSPAVAKPLRC